MEAADLEAADLFITGYTTTHVERQFVSRETGKTRSLRKVRRFHVKHHPPKSDDDELTGSCRYTESTCCALRNHL